MNKPLVTCQLFGQLGNQLYQIATTLAYSWDHDALAIFPELYKTEDRIAYNRDRIFFRLDASSPPRPFRQIFRESCYYSSKRVPFRPDQILSGYFQSWCHFHHHRDKLLPLLTPHPSIIEKMQNKYRDLLARDDTVAVHVRTFAQHTHQLKIHPFLNTPYYRDAICQFPKDATFVVFSDRIQWCKAHFPKELEAKMIFIEGNDGIEDLYLMSQMKHFIVCNSTYSWWAAYLSQHPEKSVIVPKYCPNLPKNFPFDEYYLPGWKVLPVNPDIPYPEDIDRYDNGTQSLNG